MRALPVEREGTLCLPYIILQCAEDIHLLYYQDAAIVLRDASAPTTTTWQYGCPPLFVAFGARMRCSTPFFDIQGVRSGR